tara:strand:+ start:732 stop:983 length:252 start_codon:yes stop_codon:yes gene_type:complete
MARISNKATTTDGTNSTNDRGLVRTDAQEAAHQRRLLHRAVAALESALEFLVANDDGEEDVTRRIRQARNTIDLIARAANRLH